MLTCPCCRASFLEAIALFGSVIYVHVADHHRARDMRLIAEAEKVFIAYVTEQCLELQSPEVDVWFSIQLELQTILYEEYR
jgi:hypothetical protein